MTDLGWLDAIEARLAAATPGPWRWRNSSGDVHLFGKGLQVVMGFARMGMQRAQPVFRDRKEPAFLENAGKENLYSFPDAEFIANAPADIARLVKALRDAHAKLERVEALAADLESWPSPYRGMPVAAEAIRAALAGEGE